MRIKIFISTIIVLVFYTCSLNAQIINKDLISDNIKREYIIYAPKKVSAGMPLLIALHGHGGTAKLMMNKSGFNEIADRENFFVIYPDGIKKGWNDGRNEIKDGKNDVQFISEIIDKMIKDFNIDSSRIYVTGISNGGLFCFYLALKLNNRICAIAPVAANIPEDYEKEFKLEKPVSLMLINGTDDPLIPYEGGKIGFKNRKSRGNVTSTEKSIQIFLEQNKCDWKYREEEFPDTDNGDKCKAVKYCYKNGNDNSEVVLIKVINGGHTWPGGEQYLPKFLIGNLCMDFSASEEIWKFFKNKIRN